MNRKIKLTKCFWGLPLLPLQRHTSPFSGSLWYLLFITYFFVSLFHLMFFASLFHLYYSDHNPFWAAFLFTFWDSLDCFWLVSVSHSTFLMQWVGSFLNQREYTSRIVIKRTFSVRMLSGTHKRYRVIYV